MTVISTGKDEVPLFIRVETAPHFQKSIWQSMARSQMVTMLFEAVIPLLGIIKVLLIIPAVCPKCTD